MGQFRNFIKTLKGMGLNSIEAMDLISKNEYFYNIAHYKKVVNKNQFGGNPKKKIIKFNKKKYTFYKTIDDDRIIYTLNSQNKDIHDCIIIYIDKEYNTAYIETIGNNKGCVIISIVEKGGGNKLVRMALKLIKKIKNKYNIKYIYLTDNANKTFFDDKNVGYNIKLSNLTFFSRGSTYYEKHGFVPIDVDINGKVRISKSSINEYYEEKNILLKPLSELKIDFNKIIKNINVKHNELIDNIIKNKNNKKLKNVSINTFLKYYINKKEYIPIIDILLKNIIRKNKIMIPKMWGMSL